MKKCALALTTLLVFALLFGTIGCGGGGNDKDEILGLLDEQMVAMNNVDVQTVYEQRTPGYKSRVTLEEYAAFIELVFGQYFREVVEGGKQVKLTNLNVDVEGEWGYMTGQLVLNGDVVLSYTDEAPDVWRKVGGTWYDAEENPQAPGYDPNDLP